MAAVVCCWIGSIPGLEGQLLEPMRFWWEAGQKNHVFTAELDLCRCPVLRLLKAISQAYQTTAEDYLSSNSTQHICFFAALAAAFCLKARSWALLRSSGLYGPLTLESQLSRWSHGFQDIPKPSGLTVALQACPCLARLAG